jgi:hypothetical protein
MGKQLLSRTGARKRSGDAPKYKRWYGYTFFVMQKL